MIDNFRYHFFKAAQGFSDMVVKYKLQGLIVPDHIAYKCSSSQEYEAIKSFLKGDISWLNEPIISERRIATGKLADHLALPTVSGKIHYLELQDQKPDGSQESGFDHIEVLPNGITPPELIKKLSDKNFYITEDFKPHHCTWLFSHYNVNDIKYKITLERLADKIAQELASAP